MRRTKLISRHSYLLLLGLGACVAQTSGCGSGDGGLVDDGGASALGGKASTGHGGTSASSGGSGASSGGKSVEAGASGIAPGSAGAPGNEAGATGAVSSGGTAPASGGFTGVVFAGAGGEAGAISNEGGKLGAGGTLSAGQGGAQNASGGVTIANGGSATGSGGSNTNGGVAGGSSAGSGSGGTATQMSCIFHTAAEPLPQGGEGGAGGGGPVPTITSQKNGFAGTYLADANGRALYIYGADAPGDCNNAPITNCFNDCIIAWPVFNGEPRVVGAGVDDSLFGSIVRSDGLPQTTYRGWPLYYYKNDAALGDVKGQAVGKIWQLAQLLLPNIELMRSGNTRFLGDGEGHALYTSTSDTVGSTTSAPVSSCTGTCLDDYPPFSPSYASPVTYLNASDFGYFARGDGKVQLAYKGAPLYRAKADTRSGTMLGVATGWILVAP